MADLTFKQRQQEKKSDDKFKEALRDLGRDEEDIEWIVDENDLNVDLNELFAE